MPEKIRCFGEIDISSKMLFFVRPLHHASLSEASMCDEPDAAELVAGFGPVVKVDQLAREMIQNDETKEPFA